MKDCKFCKFDVDELGSVDEFGDYLEGEHVREGEVEMYLNKLEFGRNTTLCVRVEVDRTDMVRFEVGNTSGYAEVPTGFECTELIEVRFCPMCGREL